jgi:hypothetical protein
MVTLEVFWFTQVPAPVEEIVIDAGPLTTLIPAPPIILPGAGVAPVLPMTSCPFVIVGVETHVPELFVTMAALLLPAVNPVPNGNPVALVNIPELGVPKAGVVKVGDTEPAKAPVPDCPVRDVFTALLVAIIYP